MRLLLALLLCLFSLPSPRAEILLFGDLAGFTRSDPKTATDADKNDLVPRATLFYSGKFGKTRLLAEYTIDDQDSHLGRAKLGRELGEDQVLWLGRLHNPTSYWRSQFHHAAYLQATISRPAISEFESSGGVIPSHLSGLSLEGLSARGEGGWRYLVAGGFGPTFENSGLEMPKILSGSRGEHDSTLALRLGWLPDSLSGNEAGLFASRNHLASRIAGINEVEQVFGGVYLNREFGRLSLLSEFYYVSNELYQSSVSVRDSFTSGYLQAGYQFNRSWQLSGRAEQSWGWRDDAYLAWFPEFIYQRRVLAVRYELARHHALKLELDRSHHYSGHAYNQAGIQWTFVFP